MTAALMLHGAKALPRGLKTNTPGLIKAQREGVSGTISITGCVSVIQTKYGLQEAKGS